MINLAEERAKFEANRPVDCGCYCDAMPVLLAFVERMLGRALSSSIVSVPIISVEDVLNAAHECGIEVPDG